MNNDVEIQGVRGKSGMIQVADNGSSMFYWLMEKINGNVTSDDAPLVLWL
jgi:predicted lipoprotein with Yx(FWY)xxD motif